MMSKLHDNEIISYEVNLSSRTITIYTQFKTSDSCKGTSMVFYDVLAHFFENELSGSVILEIDEYSIESFIEDNRLLLDNRKNGSWPTYYKTLAEFKEKLINEQYNFYGITPSYGLGGWILAKCYEVR